MSGKYLPRPHPALYEINTAAWLFELSRKAGKELKLGDVPPAEWDKLRQMGMDFVWLLGVWSRSQAGRKISQEDADFQKAFAEVLPGCTDEDIIGSCFAMGSDDPDPLIGSWEDIDHARSELHQRGMGLILDFIPNHTGMDHPWLSENPEYYIQVPRGAFEKYSASFFSLNNRGRALYLAHGKDPYFPAWTDTAQLNFFNPATHRALIDWLKRISRHCDGVRCDMAMLVLKEVFEKTWGWANQSPHFDPPAEEFWTVIRRELPDLLLIAEAYWDREWDLQQLGFDYVYDKKLYDRLRDAKPSEVRSHLQADREYQNKLVRFIENHDESRSAVVFPGAKLETVVVLFSTLPGMKLYFHGQMQGRQLHLPIQIRHTRPEEPDAAIEAFYAKLLPVVNQEAFHTGEWTMKEVLAVARESPADLLAWLWKGRRERLYLVLVNLGPEPAAGRVSFEDAVAEDATYSLQGKLARSSFSISGKLMAHPGLEFRMGAYEPQIFEIARED